MRQPISVNTNLPITIGENSLWFRLLDKGKQIKYYVNHKSLKFQLSSDQSLRYKYFGKNSGIFKTIQKVSVQRAWHSDKCRVC